MEALDDVQVALMEEKCIVINEKDEIIGYDTKKNCMKTLAFSCTAF